ncbi:B3 domain-containing protein [Hirschfeldia incana]|nr:B3 domain-containing protein [Hirschfeldia incana]
MSGKSVYSELQDNVSKPRFCKSLSLGQTWSSKSMRIIPEEFVRSAAGAFEHRVVFSVRWGNSWQLWLQRDKNGLFIMEEEDWDEFVSDNFLAPNDVLFFIHVDTMFIEVQIYKQRSHHLKEITSAPLEADPQAEVVTPVPQRSPLETPAYAPASASGAREVDDVVKNPEQYLSNPRNPFFVKTLGKKNDVLYVSHLVTGKYGLKYGPHYSTMHYLLPNERIEALTKIYGGCPCFSGWASICRKYKLKQGDSVVCELDRSGEGVVTAVRVHFVK